MPHYKIMRYILFKPFHRIGKIKKREDIMNKKLTFAALAG